MPHMGIVEQTSGERNFKEHKATRCRALGRFSFPPLAAQSQLASGEAQNAATFRGSAITSYQSPVHGLRLDHGFVLRQLRPQTPLQLLAEFRDLHSRHHNELARQHFARIVVIWQLAGYTAILAILVPAESPVRNCFRADELKAA